MHVGPTFTIVLILQSLLLTLSSEYCIERKTEPSRPENVSIIPESNTSVRIQWHINTNEDTKFEIVYRPLNHTNSRYREKVTLEVNEGTRAVLLDRLLPTTRYSVYVSAIHGDIRNDSTPVEFQLQTHQMPGSNVYMAGEFRVRGEELGIVLLVFAVWISAIALFFNRWGKIRMLEPYQPNYKDATASLTNSLEDIKIERRPSLSLLRFPPLKDTKRLRRLDHTSIDQTSLQKQRMGYSNQRTRSLEDCGTPGTIRSSAAVHYSIDVDSSLDRYASGSLEASRRVKSAIDIAAMFVYGAETKEPSREEQKRRLSDLIQQTKQTPSIQLETDID